MALLSDNEFAQALARLELPEASVEDAGRQAVYADALALHNMEPDELEKLAVAADRCAANALAFREKVRRVVAAQSS